MSVAPILDSFEDSAEEKCKEYLDLALDADSSNAEAYHLLSSYWLSKDKKEVAYEMVLAEIYLGFCHLFSTVSDTCCWALIAILTMFRLPRRP